jgi:hypothetical protein
MLKLSVGPFWFHVNCMKRHNNNNNNNNNKHSVTHYSGRPDSQFDK